MNDGICRGLVGDYRCECLGSAYSGHHCEFISNKIVTYQMVSKSFSYVAIITMCAVMSFIIGLDMLKYIFDIDSMEPLPRQEKHRRKNKLRSMKLVRSHRPVYVP